MNTQILTHHLSFSLSRPSLAGWIAGLAARVALWRERSRSRRRLAAMDQRELKDIGLSRADAWREINKPGWEE